jgi:hypothetical protein
MRNCNINIFNGLFTDNAWLLRYNNVLEKGFATISTFAGKTESLPNCDILQSMMKVLAATHF